MTIVVAVVCCYVGLVCLLFYFKQTSQHFLQQIYVKKCLSSIPCWDSNPQPLEHESPPIIARPGLPPRLKKFLRRYLGIEKNENLPKLAEIFTRAC